MPFKNYPTCHCHQASLDTASTPEAFAVKELELGTGYLTVTDHGTLNSARKVYDLAKKNKLTPIVGLEAYLRDDDCEILKKFGIVKQRPVNDKGEVQLDKPETISHYSKYFHVTMHALDQEAYELMVQKLSAADSRAEKHGSERKPLFTWADLEELGSRNVTMTSSCLVGVVQRHLVDHNRIDIAMAYYEKMRSVCKSGNFYTEIFPHKCDKNWESAGYVTYQDGTRERLPAWKKLKLKDGGDAQLKDYARRWSPGREDELLAVMENRKFVERQPKLITNIEVVEGFTPNECRTWAKDGDVQRGANLAVLYMAEKYGDKVIIGDDSHYAHPEDKIVQDIRLQSGGGSWRFYGHYHRQSSQEAFEHFRQTLGVDEKTFTEWVDNNYAWAEKSKDFKFKTRQTLPTNFYPKNTLEHTIKLINKHGRMNWNDPVYVKRLQAEINMLHYNGTVDLLPYFMIDEEVCDFFSSNGKLTGPGRGSAAGLLLTYLLRITHVDPLKYGLSMERFLTQTRIKSGKMPDIDQDLPKKHRDMLVNPVTGWLRQRFGDCYAHISVDTSLKLRSAVKDVARVIHDGHIPDEINGLTARFENAPQGISDRDFVFGYKGSEGWVDGSIKTDAALQEYIERYPNEWAIVQKCLGLIRQKAPHACGFVIANEPISNFIPMTSLDGEPVTQYTAPSVEAVGGLKMDFLGLNSLDDIAEAIKLIQGRGDWKPEKSIIDGKTVLPHEIVPYNGKLYSIWELPEDQAVFRDICEGKTESLFQFDTPSVRQWLKHFDHVKRTEPNGTVHKALDSIDDLASFTALDRPGPLDAIVSETGVQVIPGLVSGTVDPNTGVNVVAPRIGSGRRESERGGGGHNMLVEFANRAKGLPAVGAIPKLMELLPETHGVIVFQEGLQKVYQVVGQTSAEQADEFRVHISKKKMSDVIKDKETFMPGAIKVLGEVQANELWKSLETFGQYGFNKSHATAYVIITYACAFLKRHFPLEWWTAVLRNADRNEVNEKFWPYCGKLIDFPDIRKSSSEFEIRGERIQAPFWLLKGIGEKAQEQILANGPYTDIQDFCTKIQAWRTANGTKVIRTKKNKKTGEVTEVPSIRCATTALNSRVMTTLIISGAVDGLFPEKEYTLEDGTVKRFPMTAGQKLQAYRDAAISAGLRAKKKGDDVDISDVSPLAQYQMRKQVLPALTEDLEELVVPHLKDKLVRVIKDGVTRNAIHYRPTAHRPGDNEENTPDYPIANTRYLEMIDVFDVPVATALYAAVGYVTAERRWRYPNRSKAPNAPKTVPAVELTIDVQGHTVKAVKWPVENILPAPLDKSLVGAVVVALLRKRPKKNATVDDVLVVQPPLNAKLDEASPEEEAPNE